MLSNPHTSSKIHLHYLVRCLSILAVLLNFDLSSKYTVPDDISHLTEKVDAHFSNPANLRADGTARDYLILGQALERSGDLSLATSSWQQGLKYEGRFGNGRDSRVIREHLEKHNETA